MIKLEIKNQIKYLLKSKINAGIKSGITLCFKSWMKFGTKSILKPEKLD